ncbi:chromosome segregation protein ScpA [Moraxella bovoculi]|uniref:Segregation and condensation protein A n=1 Tax=Moraxella bovoculi TaxID=386891 RepID=A0AAC8PWC2_9GAMM|nr:ScpA family protein [Moraxella bovoculi]AKG07572.1 chromosome segregation protein ScpA [Moraxella bovoculi]AKG09826.1 chromosome segregation protein ScpA [Moraxella bovoculi]AKG11745.1 chromosome segregation protein ScpA [Moraxella bovoculi]AKG13711.1 chromosome segregation protein ScpA [Moraxella bovoculi]
MMDTAQVQDVETIRIFDTPVESLPDDLYIPPQAFAIWLEQFAGPLDFLLYLVKKNNFDLTETAILPITEQYLSYIKDLDEEYFELAGDYLLMAGTLIAIKSELLLPQPEIDDEGMNPKARLIRKLEEYAQIKEAAQRLDKLIRLERDVFLAFTSLPSIEAMRAELPKYSPQILVNSLITMQIKPDYQMHTVNVDPVPLPERIANITRMLSEKGSSTFKELLEPTQGKLGVVVSFVAVLELIKRGLVGLSEYSDDFDDESADNYALQTTEKRAKNTLPNIDNAGHAIGEQTLYWLH